MTDTSISPLRRRMIEDMKIRGFTAQTQTGYLRVVRDFAAFVGRPPDEADAQALRRYQLHLRSGGVSATGMNAAVLAEAEHRLLEPVSDSCRHDVGAPVDPVKQAENT